MENCWDEKNAGVEEPLLELEAGNKKGGLRSLPFIMMNDALEKMATYGLIPSMTLYLMKQYHMEMTTASNVLFLWSASINVMPLLGAILADSFLGRFYTIGFGSVIAFVGMIILWSTTIIPEARPPPCDQSGNSCSSATFFQFLYLYASLGLISIGAGGVRSCSLAFGANQLEKEDTRKELGVKGSYFNWFYASQAFSILIAGTFVVYIQDNMGWKVGFAVPPVLMLLGVLLFFLASPLYIKLKSKTNLVTSLTQVILASYRNRHFKISDRMSVTYHYNCSAPVPPSEKLRFLNKACIVEDPQKDLTPDGRAKNPWSLCTVDQVKDLKALINVIPIWSTGVLMSVDASQRSFQVLQASSVNRHIISNFIIPAASYGTFTLLSLILWITFYDRLFLPLASKIKGRQVHISTKRRMGIGIFLSFLTMMLTAVVESVRRAIAIKQGYLNHPEATMHMSIMWLVPQYCLIGFAEASTNITQNEFYFSELPTSMSSIASTLNGIGQSGGNLAASFILNSVDTISRSGGNESWISSNINKGHYDYYYLVLGGLSMANFIYFLFCSHAYGPLRADTVSRTR